MPLIALDARKYHDFGIGTYIQHLIHEYALFAPVREFLLFLDANDAETIAIPDQWKTSVAPYGKYSLGEIFLFGRKVNASKASVFHSPHYTLPFGIKSRSVVTIHDLIHLRFPQFLSPLQRVYSYGMMRHAIRDSQSIITDTEFTKCDILRSFRVKEEKIIPIHLGVSEQYNKEASRIQLQEFRKKFNLMRPYIFFAGNTKPHKGLHILLRAFRMAIAVFSDVDLVFAGGDLTGDAELRSLVNDPKIAAKLRPLGRISNEDLVVAYQGAEMFVLPSLYEGFGLPALEAMACGIPVIVSNAGSLPEVVGNAAIICESGNDGMFGDAIVNLLRDPRLKKDMVEKGKEHVKKFSWRVTAEKTMKVYDNI